MVFLGNPPCKKSWALGRFNARGDSSGNPSTTLASKLGESFGCELSSVSQVSETSKLGLRVLGDIWIRRTVRALLGVAASSLETPPGRHRLPSTSSARDGHLLSDRIHSYAKAYPESVCQACVAGIETSKTA